MSPGSPSVTIVGLGLIGSSVGLALRRAGAAGVIVGHDEDAQTARLAKELGAVERTDRNPASACRAADLVILAAAVGALEELLQMIGPELKPGCVVVDTTSLKRPVLDWAEQHLPDHVHFVGGNPIIAATMDEEGTRAARADLFQGGLFCLTPSPRADAGVLSLATSMVKALGAEPFFCDAQEHDGLLAAVEHLPAFLAFALLQAIIPSPSWREMRKVAGPTFELATRLTMSDPRAEAHLSVSNRDNLLRWIDEFSCALGSLREQLARQQSEELGKRFAELQIQRNEWLASRGLGHWDYPVEQKLPERPGLLEGLIGGGLRKKLRGDR